MIQAYFPPEPELSTPGFPACVVAVLHHPQLRLSQVLVLPHRTHACLLCPALPSEFSSRVPLDHGTRMCR